MYRNIPHNSYLLPHNAARLANKNAARRSAAEYENVKNTERWRHVQSDLDKMSREQQQKLYDLIRIGSVVIGLTIGYGQMFYDIYKWFKS